jgi:hypothetical protein
MNITNYIEKLEALRAEHGDIEVETYGVRGDRVTVADPILAFRKTLGSHQRTPAFWSRYDPPETRGEKGEKVVRL